MGLLSPPTHACPKCAEAGLRMKLMGFRDWRTGYACFEHAAVNLDRWLFENGVVTNGAGRQADLFEVAG